MKSISKQHLIPYLKDLKIRSMNEIETHKSQSEQLAEGCMCKFAVR